MVYALDGKGGNPLGTKYMVLEKQMSNSGQYSHVCSLVKKERIVFVLVKILMKI